MLRNEQRVDADELIGKPHAANAMIELGSRKIVADRDGPEEWDLIEVFHDKALSGASSLRPHSIGFSSGVMTSATINGPSVALAIANLPLTVIKAILSAPAALLTLQVTNIQDQSSLLQQEKALIDAQTALQKSFATQNDSTGK